MIILKACNMPEFEVGLGLGSNIGDKAANIFQSLRLLAADGRVRIDKISPLYRTAPWGHVAQDFFANACALITTQMSPLDLLAFVKNIEAAMGRAQSERWGPRLIDIDLLYYGDIVFHDAKLALPHPELFNRACVLVPLAGIAPGLRIGGRSVAKAANALAGEGVVLWDGTSHIAP